MAKGKGNATAKFEVMSNAEYRQREGLASTDIKRMMKSMATWKYFVDHPEEERDTPALKFGRAYHKFCLEPYDFENEYIVCPKIDKRTKDGKAAYEEFLKSAGNKEVIDEETYEQLVAMRTVLYATPYVKKLINGEHEKSFFWTDEKTGIKCKCRPDSFGAFGSGNVIVDLKTTSDAETEAFMRSALKFNYDVQAAHYTAGLETIYGKEFAFVFIAQETKAPYLVNVLQADDYFMQNGRDVRDQMLNTYKKCIELNEYPAYNGFKEEKRYINSLSLPKWLINAMEYEADDFEESESESED